jgi:hypothetical protein
MSFSYEMIILHFFLKCKYFFRKILGNFLVVVGMVRRGGWGVGGGRMGWWRDG